jgi:hypothetical protein
MDLDDVAFNDMWRIGAFTRSERYNLTLIFDLSVRQTFDVASLQYSDTSKVFGDEKVWWSPASGLITSLLNYHGGYPELP